MAKNMKIGLDSSIIHEINHQMISDELLLIESEEGNSYISRSGLNLDGINSDTEKINEIIETMIYYRDNIKDDR